MGDHYIYMFLFFVALVVIGLGIENYKPSCSNASAEVDPMQ